MREGQPHRVQPLPGQPQVRREHGVGAVEQVAAARVAQRGHVHPDLVGAAGLQADAHQAGRPERLKRVVVGDARPPAGDHREPAVAGRMPPDGRVDGAAQRVRMPLDESVVRLGHGALAECLLEHAVGALALGDHHQPGGVGVQPVHDALAFGGPAGGHRMPGGEQAAEHGGPRPAGRGMRRDAARLVHHRDVVVLVDDLQAARRLRGGHGVPGRRQRHRHRGARQHPVGLGGRLAVEQDLAGPDQFRRAGAGQPEHPGQRRVKPLPVQSFRDLDVALPLAHWSASAASAEADAGAAGLPGPPGAEAGSGAAGAGRSPRVPSRR